MMERIIRYVFLLFLSLQSMQVAAQYPTTGNKQRLGYQTTGDGLVFRGSGAPAYTPTSMNNAWMFLDTTANDLYAYISGSWQLIGGGGGSAFDGYVDSLVFNTTVSVVDSTGKMYYDAGNETISVGIDGGVVYQMGQELFYPLVINKSGATIHNGQLVMVDTLTLVTGDHVRVIPARNGANYPSSYIMGVATADIPNDSLGLVTFFGYVREVKHADIAETGRTLDAGDILYPSAVNPGKYTDVAPATPAHKSTIALVVRKPSDNNMTLLVRPWLAPKLANLSDVNTSSVGGLSVLRYNSTTGVWDASATAGIVAADTASMLVPYQKDITITTTGTSGAATFNGVTLNVPQYQAALTNPVTGTGTANQIATWSGTNTMTGSSSYTYSGGNVLQTKASGELVNTFSAQDAIGTSVRSRFELTAGAATSSSANYKNMQLVVLPKNYTDGFVGGTYGAGGSTLLSYSGQDTTNSNLTFAITSVAGVPTANFRGSFRFLTSSTNNYTVADEIARLNRTGFGFKQSSPQYSIDINATDGIRIPTGTTVQRPTGAAGVLRFNSTDTRLEYHTGSAWTQAIAGSGTSGQVSYWDGTGTQTGSSSLTWSEANKTLGVNTSTTSGANIIVKNTQEPVRNTSWLPTQTFGADTVNWTKGTGWTFNGTVAVAVAATGALTYTSLPDTIISGRAYEVRYTLTGYATGTLTVAVGNASLALPRHDIPNNTILLLPTGAAGGFRFTTSTFTGNIDNVSVVEISNPVTILFAGQDDASATLYNPLRMPNATTIAFNGGGAYNTAANNNFFGYLTGETNTTGGSNNFFGFQAGKNNTSGITNNFFGNSAGQSNTIGGANNFYGNEAGYSNTYGSSNNFFGNSAGKVNTGGGGNNFFGSSAGVSNTLGNNNNFFGSFAGQFNTIGNNNNFYGRAAGLNNTTGNGNMFIGEAAGQQNTTGGTNTFIGSSAGYINRSGSNNIFIGRLSGYSETLADTLTGSSNTAMGVASATNIRAGAAGNLVLGNSVNLPTAAGSNQVVIKNVIFATGASGTGTSIATGALVGINTNAPAYKLDVFGTDGIRIPVGTEAQRPTGAAGVVRYSSTSGALEYHTGTKWDTVATRGNLVSSEVHYIPLTAYSIGDTVANGSSKAFFLVPAGMNGWCIDSYTVRAISGSGSATVQILDSGTGSFAQAISGTTIYTKDSNVPLSTGDYIQLDISSVSGTLLGLSSTLEIKKTCN